MLRNLPKIELHCHLDGSLRGNTIIDIAKIENIQLPSYNIDEINKLTKVPMECTSLVEYLKKFDLPNKVMQSKESLRRITFELLEDVSKDNVKYIEIRFAPLLHIQKGLKIDDIIQSLIDGINDAEKLYPIKANIILSCMRTMSEEDALLVINEGKKFIGNKVVGIDLCGPEDEGFARHFEKCIKVAKESGYRVTIHAGEAASSLNVLEAIKILGAERIGHGVRLNSQEEAYKIVKENNVTLEMCPTSNIHTKAVSNYKEHPFYEFYKDGVKVSLNTDNRTVSDIDLTNEFNSIYENSDISVEDYKKIYLDTVNATFADEKTKDWIRSFI